MSLESLAQFDAGKCIAAPLLLSPTALVARFLVRSRTRGLDTWQQHEHGRIVEGRQPYNYRAVTL